MLAALICHFLFYLVPGLLGRKTGLPLYIVGTSTFGAIGGLFMPGFLMGLLQFGWLASTRSARPRLWRTGFQCPWLFYPLCVIWAVGAAFVGLKGIQYVAKVATYLPVIPLAVLLLGLVLFGGSALSYTPPAASERSPADGSASCCDGQGDRRLLRHGRCGGRRLRHEQPDDKDVQMGGYVGIIAAILLTAGISAIAVAGARAAGVIDANVHDGCTDDRRARDETARSSIRSS